MGPLTQARTIVVLLVAVAVASCAKTHLEAYTTEDVALYSQPVRPNVAGNTVLAIIPPYVTLKVSREVLQKDLAAYEVEYSTTTNGNVRGYLLLGSSGLRIKRSTEQ